MSLRDFRRRLQQERKHALQRFTKHKRQNLLAKPGCHSFVIVLDNLKPSFNIGKIIRSAEAFGAREVRIIGVDFFDPAPAMGCFKWVPVRFHDDFDSCYRELKSLDYRFYAAEPDTDNLLQEVSMPVKSAFVFGHEEYGISFDKSDYPDIGALTIRQFGKVESLNVSIAASVVMYEYVRQYGGHRA